MDVMLLLSQFQQINRQFFLFLFQELLTIILYSAKIILLRQTYQVVCLTHELLFTFSVLMVRLNMTQIMMLWRGKCRWNIESTLINLAIGTQRLVQEDSEMSVKLVSGAYGLPSGAFSPIKYI